MSNEVVPNLVTYVNNKRQILAVPNSSNPRFLVSLRYKIYKIRVGPYTRVEEIIRHVSGRVSVDSTSSGHANKGPGSIRVSDSG
eukprot:363264-Chlamydomonas_euryale.AAC.3